MGRKLGHPDDGGLYILASLLMLLVFMLFTIGLVLYWGGGDSNGLEETGYESSTVPVQSVPGQQEEQERETTNSQAQEKTLVDTSGAKGCVGIGEHLVCEGQILVVE